MLVNSPLQIRRAVQYNSEGFEDLGQLEDLEAKIEEKNTEATEITFQ